MNPDDNSPAPDALIRKDNMKLTVSSLSPALSADEKAEKKRAIAEQLRRIFEESM